MFDWSNIASWREGNRLEAKLAEGGLPDSLWATYSAFANTEGGIIALGVREKGDGSLEPVGVANAEQLEKQLWRGLNNPQKVSANVLTDQRAVRTCTVEGRKILLIEVPRAQSADRPVYINGNPLTGSYRRRGEGDYHCGRNELRSLTLEAMPDADRQPLIGLSKKLLLKESIIRYRNRLIAARPEHPWCKKTPSELLVLLGAIARHHDDNAWHPTRAGMLLFADVGYIRQLFPSFRLDYIAGPITNYYERIVCDDGAGPGNVVDFLTRVLPRLTADLQTPFAVSGFQRIDQSPLEPLLREALVNALQHADYDANIHLSIHRDHDGFRFTNPGTMLIAPSEAIAGGVSKLRNTALVNALSLLNYSERVGSGLKRIFDEWTPLCGLPSLTQKYGEDRCTGLFLPWPDGGPDPEALRRRMLGLDPVPGSLEDIIQRGGKPTTVDLLRRKLAATFL